MNNSSNMNIKQLWIEWKCLFKFEAAANSNLWQISLTENRRWKGSASSTGTRKIETATRKPLTNPWRMANWCLVLDGSCRSLMYRLDSYETFGLKEDLDFLTVSLRRWLLPASVDVLHWIRTLECIGSYVLVDLTMIGGGPGLSNDPGIDYCCRFPARRGIFMAKMTNAPRCKEEHLIIAVPQQPGGFQGSHIWYLSVGTVALVEWHQ